MKTLHAHGAAGPEPVENGGNGANAIRIPLDERADERGITLLELVLVMLILGIVVGGGLGVFAALDLGRHQALGLVKNAVRSAQNSALASQAPARVRFDRAAGSLVAESMQVIGTWHLEGQGIQGAFGLSGSLSGGAELGEGWLGQGLWFPGRSGAHAQIPVQHDPGFDLADGFTLECVVRRDPLSAGKIVQVGSVVALLANASGAVRGKFTTRVEHEGTPQRGGDVFVESAPGVLVPERWTRLELEYDRVRLTLYADGVALATIDESAPVWPVDGPLLLSDPRYPFSGALDCLVVRAMVRDEPVLLPESVRLGPRTPAELLFDAGGRLDRGLHPGPATVELVFDDGSVTTLVVGSYGVVE